MSDFAGPTAATMRAISDPGSILPRLPDESVTAWQTRAVLEAAGPLFAAAERKRIVELAVLNGASYWRKVMSSDDPPQQYLAEFPFEDLIREMGHV